VREVLSLVATIIAIGISWRFARSTMTDFTGVCVTIAVSSITWNAVKPIAFPLSDFLLLLSAPAVIIKLVRQQLRAPIPLGAVIGILLVAVAVLLNALLPVTQAYSNARYGANTGVVNTLVPHPSEAFRIITSIEVGIKLLVGMLIMPLAIMTVAPDRRRLTTMFDLWGISALVNAFFALVGYLHVFQTSAYLIGPQAAATGRQFGLTNHPNHLATVLVMSIPVVLSWWRRGGRWQRASAASIVLVLIALVASGSRGGLAAGALIITIAVLSQREVRRAILPFVVPAVLIVAALAVADLNAMKDLLHHTRFFGGSGSGSDTQRLQVARQAILDIKHRPLLGIGFDVADQGHSIYLQAIASGGVLTLAALVTYVAGVLAYTKFRLMDYWHGIVLAVAVSLMAWLVLGAIENDFADRYPYVPIAMLLAIAAVRAREADLVDDAAVDDVPRAVSEPQYA
jgi:O-antigen ligase